MEGGERQAEPRLLADSAEIGRTVARLGEELSRRYEDGTVLVAVLKGGVVFLSDLIRVLAFDPVVDFLAVSAYPSGGGRVRLVKDLSLDISGADVVLVTDVVDTGLSLTYLKGELERRGPRSISLCALADKERRRLVPLALDHVGLVTEADYLIGYGLGFAGRYRNLDLLAEADLEALARDPDCYLGWAYPRAVGRG